MSKVEQLPFFSDTFAAVQRAIWQQGGRARRVSSTIFEIQGYDLREHYLLRVDPSNPLEVDIVFLTGNTPPSAFI